MCEFVLAFLGSFGLKPRSCKRKIRVLKRKKSSLHASKVIKCLEAQLKKMKFEGSENLVRFGVWIH